MGKFCDIQSRNELADFLKIPRSRLTYVLFIVGSDNCYSTFEIPKKTGGVRTICAPNEDLKSIQKKLAEALYSYQALFRNAEAIVQNVSHAFEKDKGIITNARKHRNKRYVLNLDLENFFNSFHIGRVIGYFEKNRHFNFPHEVAVTIGQISCYKGCLPQGAPSSPIITNLICEILDMRLLSIARKYKLDYTRYADDITFSTNRASFLEDQADFLSEVSAVIEKSGFTINQKKTRLQYKQSKQKVTGLIVNQKVNIDRDYSKETRAMAYQQYKTGSFEIGGNSGTLNQLEGRFSFINQLDQYNNQLDGKRHGAYYLNGREKQYQAFLFYKYFYLTKKPLIVTEGKTDILYLKAALKKLYKEYPNLIEKNEKGEFTFKISFFRRSARWKYFFDMSMDGADAISKLYGYYVEGEGTPNYFDYFHNLTGKEPANPVIFLFDNEMISDRPLRKFIGGRNIQKNVKPELESHQKAQMILESKLYIMTNPLVEGHNECEIEDLFPAEILNQKIDGRSFSRNGKGNIEKYYNKDVFSRHIYSNYENIDFSGFKELLDTLDSIVVGEGKKEEVFV